MVNSQLGDVNDLLIRAGVAVKLDKTDDIPCAS